MMRTLIVGGSSGLGLALAKEFTGLGDEVIVTGRRDPEADFADFKPFDLVQPDLASEIEAFVGGLPIIGRLIYAAGQYSDGRLTELSTRRIDETLDISARGLIFFARSILLKQASLDGLITITSMSQWVPSPTKPVYSFVKAGMGQFSSSMALDGRIGKVLVAGPSTMTEDGSDPKLASKQWVAGEIARLWADNYSYKCIKILNNPARIEEVEKRYGK